MDLREQLLAPSRPRTTAPATQPTLADDLAANLLSDSVQDRYQILIDVMQPGRWPPGKQAVEQHGLIALKTAAGWGASTQVGQEPILIVLAGDLIHAHDAPLSKVRQRCGQVAQDHPAYQDNPQLSGPKIRGWRQIRAHRPSVRTMPSGRCFRSRVLPAAN